MMLDLTVAKKLDALLSLTSLCFTALLFALAFSVAALSHFLQMCMGKGMIFRKYNALITYWLWFKGRERRIKPWHHLITATRIDPRKWWSHFYKPLGGCIYCNSVWVAAFFYGGFVVLTGVDLKLALFLFAPYIGLMYYFVELQKQHTK